MTNLFLTTASLGEVVVSVLVVGAIYFWVIRPIFFTKKPKQKNFYDEPEGAQDSGVEFNPFVAVKEGDQVHSNKKKIN